MPLKVKVKQMTEQEKLAKLKAILGISDDTKDSILTFALEKVRDMICNYCRINDIPEGLGNVQLSMAMDIYRSESLGQEKAEGTVKSMTEGDVSVSFGSAVSSSENPGMDFLKNYTAQLNRYRKVGW